MGIALVIHHSLLVIRSLFPFSLSYDRGKGCVFMKQKLRKSLVQWLCVGVILLGAGAWFGGEELTQVFAATTAQPILVLDAGHGGFDGGAVGENGTVEQYINLAIAKRTALLAGYFGVPTVQTRPDEQALVNLPENAIRENKVADIKAREAIANSVEQSVFVSIHLNKFEQAQYYGAQVFYSPNNPISQILAQNLQVALILGIDNGNTRVEKPASTDIYLMKQLCCPAVVVECGFLSNADEEALLATDAYQKQLAVCIVAGCLPIINK